MTAIASIVEQYAEDAALLWLQRDIAVRAPHYSLQDLTKLDNRLEAQLDGLRIAEDAAWELALAQLEHPDAGAYFATMVLALGGGRKERIAAILDRKRPPRYTRGIVSALAWSNWEVAKPVVGALIAAEEPRKRAIAIAACAVARIDPGRHLAAALADRDDALRARACRAAGEFARKDLLGEMAPLLVAEDDSLRFWAAWSASLLGDPRGHRPLATFVDGGEPGRETRALALLLRVLPPPHAQDLLRTLGRDPARRRATIAAIGIYGDPAYATWLVGQMGEAPLARLAGEAFTLITGADLGGVDLRGKRPADFQSGPNDDPADPNVALDPDDKLPWPGPERVAKWWAAQKSGYAPGTRYLLGKPITPESLADVLRNGRQRQRAAAALELAIRSGGMLFETRARGDLQRRRLGVI